jgi:hypothetical protein
MQNPELLQAVSTVVLAIFTIVLVGVTIFYAFRTHSLANSAKEQLKQSREFKEAQVRNNILAIYIELKSNNTAENFKHQAPLLDAAYSSGLWSLAFMEVDDKTLAAIADAYLSIRRHTAYFDVRVDGPDAKDKSWNLAHRNIEAAIDAMEKSEICADILKTQVD